ncbi:hypothetical protein EVAR_94446_1 [Eumeta japonica]|uniref:Uncharacterized protein n=1 Tax=Eumeta variegata TaxID=151549 RepID=A0A4C1TQ59_EUMVA|nr:hypothetical protein EVAR_94446_1 [Eumeta japonica]
MHAYQIQGRDIKFGVENSNRRRNMIYWYDPKTKQQSTVWVYLDGPNQPVRASEASKRKFSVRPTQKIALNG